MNKPVSGYDENGNKCYHFNSARVGSESLQIKYKTFLNYIKNAKPINKILFIYDNIEKIPYKQLICCDNCGMEFMCETWRINIRQHLFCSKKCEGEYNLGDSNCECEICHRHFHRKMSRINKNMHNYCSIDCHRVAKTLYMSGENNHQYGLKGNLNPTWKSDERISYYGYRLIRKLEHPFKNEDDFVFEHRLVAERHLLNNENSIEINGKLYLSPDYVVHHIDFDKLNNRVENLRIMKRDEHTKLHWQLRLSNELEKYCTQNKLKYINVTRTRNGGFGSTDV